MDTTLGNYNYIYRIGDNWYANLICPITGEALVGSKDDIIDYMSYDQFVNCGVNDGMMTATKIITKGNKHALFTFHSPQSMTIGVYVCPKLNPFIYDDIMILADWKNWDDYGYVICRAGNLWTLMKVIQFPEAECFVIEENLNSLEEALSYIGLENLNEFDNMATYEWVKRDSYIDEDFDSYEQF